MSKTFTTIGMSAEVTIEAAAIEGADAKGPKRFTSVFYTGGLVTVKSMQLSGILLIVARQSSLYILLSSMWCYVSYYQLLLYPLHTLTSVSVAWIVVSI